MGLSAGGRSRGPTPEPGQRSPRARPGRRGELSFQHWRRLLPPRRAAQPEPQTGRQRGRPPAPRPPPPGRPGSRPLHRHRCLRRTAADAWGNKLTELLSPTRGALDAGSRPPRGCKVVGSAPLAHSLLTICFGDWAGSGGVGRREWAAAVLPLGHQRVGARKPRGWQLDNPQPRHPSLSSWGRCSGHPSQHRGLAPHSSPPSSGAGWGVLPDFSHRFRLESRFSPDVDVLAIIYLLLPSPPWLTTLPALYSGTEKSLGV